MFDKYWGREIPHCYTMGQRINFNWDGTVSLCHGIEAGDYIIGKVENIDFSAKGYEKIISKILEKCLHDEKIICRNCSNFKKNKFETSSIKVITINTACLCNCKCIYCSTWSKRAKIYNPLPYIKKLVESGIVDKDCFFDWGGGEPILNPYFEETFSYLEKQNFYQRVNTNSLIYSEFLMSAMNRGRCLLRTSLDAGDPETFLNVKGLDAFEETCNNIAKYSCKNESRVTVKYVLNSANKSTKSIEGFLDFCNGLGVDNVVLDADLNSYSNELYHGPLFFTESELSAAHYFQSYALEKGIKVNIGYVYTAGTNVEGRDYNFMDGEITTCYTLPLITPKSIKDKNIFCNGILLQSFASMDALKKSLKSGIVYMDGMVGLLEKMMLEKNDFKMSRIIKASKQFKEIEDVLLCALQENQPIIICSSKYEKFLRVINEKSKNIKKVENLHVTAMEDYRYIEKESKFRILYYVLRALEKLGL